MSINNIFISSYLYITIAFDFYWFLIVAKESIKWVVFLFSQLDLLVRAYSRWKNNGCNIQARRQKIVNFHKNGGFLVVFKDKRCNYYMYIKSRMWAAYIFIVDCLSPVLSALYFQGQHWQKWFLNHKLWGEGRESR